MHYLDSGWLFQSGMMKNITKDVNEQDLFDLFRLADEEDAWGERVREEIEHRERFQGSPVINIFLDEFRVLNTYGTMSRHPYGDILTFSSTRHLYRGEAQEHELSTPTLNRKIANLSLKEQELYRAITNMRIAQFVKFLWKIHIVPYWEAKVCDVNYKALAQHYGFETHLLDLTNDFRCALFFATCRYDESSDTYYPLTSEDIEKDEKSKHGVIFHTPNWELDFHQSTGFMRLMPQLERVRGPIEIDSGLLDGTAFQIGFQPLMRCHSQSGYILPMRIDAPLQEDMRFEKLRFRQSPELSKKVFDLMEGGKKVFPYEGISRARKIITDIKQSTTFSESDLVETYEYWGTDRTIFPTIDDLRRALPEADINGKTIQIISDEVDYEITQDILNEINEMYDEIDIGQMVNGKIYMKPEHRKYREERCREIFGRVID